MNEFDRELRDIVRSAYDTCWRCDGCGMQDYGENIGACSECRGDCVVRARDSRGRFTTVPLFVPTVTNKTSAA